MSNELYQAMGDSQWTVGSDRMSSAERETKRQCGMPGLAEPKSGERDFVRAAKWLSVERLEEGMIWCQQQTDRFFIN